MSVRVACYCISERSSLSFKQLFVAKEAILIFYFCRDFVEYRSTLIQAYWGSDLVDSQAQHH